MKRTVDQNKQHVKTRRFDDLPVFKPHFVFQITLNMVCYKIRNNSNIQKKKTRLIMRFKISKEKSYGEKIY